MGTVTNFLVSGRTVRLGRFDFIRPVILAPMSGVTDLPFRRIAAGFGADLVVTEMVASESFRKGDDEMGLRSAGQGIAPHVVQLAGREAGWMAEAALMAQANGADIIDINMGCPARRVTTGWSGAALMRDLDHAMTLIEATIKAVTLPVTLKMRLGWDRATINAPELARRAEAAGVQMITVHGRTRDQFYEGRADWDAIRAVRAAVSIPLIANGDIDSFDDAQACLAASGADGVMIGRGACGRPWLPAAVSRFLSTGDHWDGPDPVALCDLIVAHHAALVDYYGPVKGVLAARKHLGWYLDAAVVRFARDAAPDHATALAVLRRTLLSETRPTAIADLIRATFDTLSAASAAVGGRADARSRIEPGGRLGHTPESTGRDTAFSPGRAA
jgi:nifR3 family TIM-barrel protein